MMGSEATVLLHSQAFGQICREHGLELAVLFGSIAAGRPTAGSDVDLAVLLDPARVARGDSHLRRAASALLKDLMHFLGTSEIDLVILNRANPLLRHQVARTGVPLYQARPSLFAEFCSLAVRQHEDSRVFYQATDRYLEQVVRKVDGHG